MSIISMLMAILLPALTKARRYADSVIGMNNQRQIVAAINLYAMDNDYKYPESVATIGSGSRWHWQEPTMLTAYRKRSPGLHRSASAYLRNYVEEADLMFWPSAPKKYQYLHEAWDAGDGWDNPDTAPTIDSVFGTYCFYWNYTGYLDGQSVFKGPANLSGGRGRSKLLVSDHLGFDHWRSRNSYGSCEPFKRARVTAGTDVSSAYWSLPSSDADLEDLGIELTAGYADGHIEKYPPSETVPMQVAITADGTAADEAKGLFYLPASALR